MKIQTTIEKNSKKENIFLKKDKKNAQMQEYRGKFS
jgi:hypothetical protein